MKKRRYSESTLTSKTVILPGGSSRQSRTLLSRVWKSIFYSYLALLLFLPILYTFLCILRPIHPLKKVYRPGIWYERQIVGAGKDSIANIVHLDLAKNDIRATITPLSSLPTPGKTVYIPARTTTSFLEELDLQVAINGDYFYPAYDYSPWHYYPHEGDAVSPAGLYMINGIKLTSYKSKGCSLCIAADDSLSIHSHDCPKETVAGIGCSSIELKDGKEVFTHKKSLTDRYPLSAIALNTEERWIELIVIDGRQPWYSEGVSRLELTSIMKERGATTVATLDGGGSSTLAIQERWGTRLLNVPVNSMIPFKQRPLATHLGFYIDRMHEGTPHISTNHE